MARIVKRLRNGPYEVLVDGRKAAFAVDLEAPMLALKNAHLPAPALPRLRNGAGMLGPPMHARNEKFRVRRRVLRSHQRA